ncbi:MAG: hypothetical protein K2P94_06875, partial [Rhodospirillaceae bacterium]|nr:hypothetical protein [Rhodospirillaceae bacterium]
MSVLFKALQKAEKENEQRQAVAAETSFDAGRLAGSGAIKFAGSRSVNWRTAGLAAAVVLAIAIAGAFFLVGPGDQPPARVAAVVPPPAAKPAMPGTTETIPVMQPPAPLSPPVAPVAGQQPLAPPPVTPATPSAPDAVAAAVSAPVVASAAQDAAANTEPVPSPAVAEAPSKPTAVPAS